MYQECDDMIVENSTVCINLDCITRSLTITEPIELKVGRVYSLNSSIPNVSYYIEINAPGKSNTLPTSNRLYP